ncbi:MAG: cation transporter [Parvibaculum sp.]|jgi:cation:H+ antiporter|nr:sodium:calcium antiporter [Parvibaculum sp.]HAC56727.1 cation transporter [Rhodobiaceae bacterium]MAU62108.1 cation transporter [Parvibaculum sp.]MBO6667000.1 sodium:calcium antiporter [Parvibaculum sp.]MBO6690444.1 sodium:calcium antiporter [Parvibaculum sp.]MBO6713621.1 sodium:calcium antiporter [Parvibaculum sp.]|tara:strand:+ start:6532 stop:7527 length:996 start_codon:yes stop_codon:yes gene_type:complete
MFLLAALVIGVAGVALTRRADMLADRTGLGEAVAGAVFLGVTTSLSGTVTSITAAAQGATSLSISNALGGIAAQTAFLAIADITYRRANLEHAAAELTNLVLVTLLMLTLSIPLLAYSMPSFTIWALHPASLVLVIVYVAGLKLSAQVRATPMWEPTQTAETRHDVPEEEGTDAPATAWLYTELAALIAMVGIAGWVIAETATVLSAQTGLSQAIMGTLFTSVATSLPELVTTLAAVRRGALQLAVGGIIGGNTYDVLFLALSDAAYRDGSLYHAMEGRHIFLIALALAMSAVLLLGLLRREKSGAGNIGFESVLVLAIYAGAILFQIALG